MENIHDLLEAVDKLAKLSASQSQELSEEVTQMTKTLSFSEVLLTDEIIESHTPPDETEEVEEPQEEEDTEHTLVLTPLSDVDTDTEPSIFSNPWILYGGGGTLILTVCIILYFVVKGLL